MGPEALIPMVASSGFFLTVFGIVYIIITARNRERMALIEKGASASIFKTNNREGGLKWGLVGIGLGLGLLLGDVLNQSMHVSEDKSPLYVFAMMLICGGAALLLYYKISTKDSQKNA